jgi:hypothetical protein
MLNAANDDAGSLSFQMRPADRFRSTSEHAACDTATASPRPSCQCTGPFSRSSSKTG